MTHSICVPMSLSTPSLYVTHRLGVWGGVARQENGVLWRVVGWARAAETSRRGREGGFVRFPLRGQRTAKWERPRFEATGTGLGEAGVALLPSSAGSGFDRKKLEGSAWPERRLYRAHTFLLLWC